MGEHEEEDGHSLAGAGPGQAARRRWFFAHHPKYQRLQEHHRTRAQRLKDRAHRQATRTARQRNKRAHLEHLAALNEYEEGRIAREESRRTWQSLKREVLNHGGIRSGTLGEDYAGVPRAVRTQNRHAPDVHDMASYFGYGDSTDEFVGLLSSTQQRASRAAHDAPARPTRPEFESEGARLSLFARHGSIRLRSQLAEYRESRDMLRQGEAELGRGHPALAELASVVRQQRQEYVDASRLAGDRPAAA